MVTSYLSDVDAVMNYVRDSGKLRRSANVCAAALYGDKEATDLLVQQFGSDAVIVGSGVEVKLGDLK